MLLHLIKSGDLEIKKLYEWELFIGRYHLVRFAGHRYCSSRDIMILVSNVIKLDHVIKESPYSNYRSSSK